ncbi:hypothetical protein N7462_002310 [Penicillium macrosclerotiorum]|uniref:uncharacterized protein n=1 Tax=Penicillium macrosclerotiorum TaxID=303699 RepID=UPI002546F784|nr:uncharacterized protein N7462_002310 [Penicillium macrosclerotiorum]KAJ5692887.1 hypothetical protein N7462_002310 [Penicillium macrosclerotiorum]
MLTGPRRRHNGQPQACEPCRKAKVRCDHSSPKCARCVLRSLTCVYHPAPMTKRRPPTSPTTSSFDAVRATNIEAIFNTPSDTQMRVEPQVGAEPSPSVADPGSAASSGLVARSHASNTSKRNTLFRKEMGHNETTRFSAVFLENKDSFGPVILDATSSNEMLEHEPNVTSPRLELAVRTLLNFPTARTCDMLLTSIHNIYDPWVSPTMIKQCLDQIWIEYGRDLEGRRTHESVLRMANDLLINDKKLNPISENDSDGSFEPSGWMNWFSGPYLRWEMIGIIFSWAGMAFRHRQEWDPVFDLPEQHGRNRNTAAENMRECTAACLKLCQENLEISDLLVICMKNSSRLQSIIISDESDRILVDFGTVRSAFITAGLHRLGPLKEVTPFSQHRASVASSMYYYDKCHSLFNARPPMLISRYCKCPLPLDLSEEDIYGGRERLAAAVAKLDSNGWNRDGNIFTASWLRALAMLSPIREGILELSLSVGIQFTKSQVEDLIFKLEKIVISYPPHIQYHGDSDWSLKSMLYPHGRSAHDIYITTRIHLDVLQCQFLLQRLLVSRQFCGGQDLFDVAQETMSVILTLWLKRDQLPELYHTACPVPESYAWSSFGRLT